MTRVILHVDMDAFYAAIEQRDDPALRGKPVIVGGPNRRGVVSTASYEARPYGVHSAMPMARALRLCPDAVVVQPRMSAYVEASRKLMDVLESFTPLYEPLSLDEAFLDMTGSERLFGAPDQIARAIKTKISETTCLTASVGIATNKFLAKLASDLDKPDGITWVPFGGETAFIAPLPIRRLWGVGPRSAERLAALGLQTIGDIASSDPTWLEQQLGASAGAHLFALSRGWDDREVIAHGRRKSVGSEVTLADDVRGKKAVAAVLRRRCEDVARQLRRSDLVASGIRVKVRYSDDFKLATRQAQLDTACDDSKTLFAASRELLERLDLDHPIRLVGAAAFSLKPSQGGQLDLFGAPQEEHSQLEHTVDSIRERFGDVIRFAD